MTRALLTVVVALGGVLGGCRDDPPPPAIERVADTARSEAWLSGDETALPLLRHLMERFTTRVPQARLRFEEPLGGEGALAALHDGVVDLVAVARPAFAPRPNGAVTFARTRAVLVTSGGTGLRRIAPERLAALVAGRASWSPGEPRVLFRLRPFDDPAQRVLASLHPQLDAALKASVGEPAWPIVAVGSDLRAELRGRPGLLAMTDRGALSLFGEPLWSVAIDGVTGDDHVCLDLVRGQRAQPAVDAFLAFLAGEEGRAFMTDLGYEVP